MRRRPRSSSTRRGTRTRRASLSPCWGCSRRRIPVEFDACAIDVPLGVEASASLRALLLPSAGRAYGHSGYRPFKLAHATCAAAENDGLDRGYLRRGPHAELSDAVVFAAV